MMRWIVGWMVTLALAASLPASLPALAGDRQTPKGVIEIFTSQGCSSCPAADRAMGYLVAQPDVIALAYHVDYWNYRGWTDTLSSAENTARQYGYAHTLGRSGVYTPQAVLNGRDQVKGTDIGAVNRRLDELKSGGNGLTVPVDAHRRDDQLTISIGAGAGKADVVVVYFRQRQDVDILKGTNKGTKVANWNSVSDVQTIGMWEGQAMRVVLPSNVLDRDGIDGCAILLQTSGPNGQPSAIIGATALSNRGKS